MRTTPGNGAPRHRHIGALALATVSGLALAACGSAATSSSNQGPGAKRAGIGIQFSDCMRAHGLANFPDPSPSGGIRLSSGSGLNPASPAFQAAQKACSKLLPGGGPGGSEVPAARKLQMLQLAQCMRRHGLSTFPDPTATPPSPGAGLGIAFGGPGAFIAVPQSLMRSPAFNQAAAACNFPGIGKGSGPRSGPAG